MSNLLNIKDQNGNWIPVPVVTNGIQSITQNQDYTLTITLNDGTTYTTTSIKGEDGQDYILTENDKQEIAGLVDTPVDDVQINGTSIVADGVANVPLASSSQVGVIRTQGTYGLNVNSAGLLYTYGANEAKIKSGTEQYQAIQPQYQHYATFYGLAKAAGYDEKDSTLEAGTYTDDAKTAIKSMIGVEDPIVDDVQVNGASIVTDGVANIPIANASGTVPVGLVKPTSATGTAVASNGGLAIVQSNLSAIKTGANQYNPIVPQHQHESVFYGLAKASGDTTQAQSSNPVGTYTDDAKASIQSMLGVLSEDEVITDVQINGASIVSNGVAEIPIASAFQLGLVRANANYGTALNASGMMQIATANSTQIKNGEFSVYGNYKPVPITRQHEATFYGLAKAAGADEKDSTLPVGQYTDEAKSAIQGMIGIGDFEIIKTVELTEDSAIIEIDTDEAGNPFKLTEMAFLMSMSPSTATTANTNAYIKNRHTTYCATLMSVVRPSATVVHGSIKNIFVSESNNDANFVILNVSNSTQSYWNLKHPTGNEKNYSEYFAVYTTGTSKFGAGTKITLLGRKK